MQKARREAFRKTLKGDWAFFADSTSIFYLTGFSGSSANLLIGPAPEHDLLITDARYQERIKPLADQISVSISSDFLATVSSHLPPAIKLAVDQKLLTMAQFKALAAATLNIEIIESKDLLTQVRMVKDPYEIEQLRKACEITSQSLWYLINDLKPGMTERQIAKKFWQNALDRGADGMAFDTIVASGINSASPHHAPASRVLQKGDAVTIDCGVSLAGYQSDMTRTVFIGAVSPWQVEIYDAVMQAQKKAVAGARIGQSANQVDQIARESISEAGFGEYFVHGTGHGVGLAVHEAPYLIKNDHTKLQENFCFTVEPGIYLPNQGGVRIEDTCLLTEKGLEILTIGSHEIICVS